MILKFVRFDIDNSTIELTFIDEETQQPVRCHNYSAEQKAEMIAEVGVNGEAYANAIGWTDALPTDPVV